MNRDEQRSRAHATGFKYHKLAKHQAYYPIDPQGGGTWLGVNDKKLTIALLNQNPLTFKKGMRAYRSRGVLIPQLLSASSSQQVAEHLSHMELNDFPPFKILTIDSRLQISSLYWNAAELTLEQETLPHISSSSSVNEESAKSYRKQKFQEFLSGRETFSREDCASFLKRSEVGYEGLSVLMSRDDAHTVSTTLLMVNKDSTQLSHYDLNNPGNGSSHYLFSKEDSDRAYGTPTQNR